MEKKKELEKMKETKNLITTTAQRNNTWDLFTQNVQSSRCRGCQFHSCLTWLHKKPIQNAKKKKKYPNEYDTISFVLWKERSFFLYWNYEKCHSNAHMWYSVKLRRDYCVDGILSISRMVSRIRRRLKHST